MRRAIFLDRDGTLNHDEGYMSDVDKYELLPKVVEGLAKMQEMGYTLIIITNQSGIGRGYYTQQDYDEFMRKMQEDLEQYGIHITKSYHSPHAPEENHPSRKPGTLMLEMAQDDFEIDLKNSWMIGDRTSDVKCGNNAGCKTILVKTGNAGKDGRNPEAKPDFVAKDLLEAANHIEKHTK